MTGGWITQADRSRLAAAGRRRAGRHPGRAPGHPRDRVDRHRVRRRPVRPGPAPPPRSGADCSPQWRQALGLDEVTETPVRGRDACLPARPRRPRRRLGQRHRDRLRRRGGQPVSRARTLEPGPGRQYRAPAGLLEKLMAAVRPEFRADDLVFDPRDPVFGGPPVRGERLRPPAPQPGPVHLALAAVAGQRAARTWPEFAATAEPGWHGHLPLDSCVIDGCNYGAVARGMCNRHFSSGIARDARTRPPGRRRAAPVPPDGPLRPAGSATAACGPRARPCSAMATTPGGKATAAPMRMSSPPPARTRAPARSTSTCGGCPPGSAWKCSTSCSAAATSRTPGCRRRISGLSSPSWPPRARRPCWTSPRNGGLPVLSRRSGHGWRAFVLDARRRVEALAFGAGWDTEYPRDTWRLRDLGIDQPEATISFTGIPQPWLRDLAKRYARWQLATGLTAATAGSGARAVTRFAAWLAALPEPPAGLDGVTARCWNATWPSCRRRWAARCRHAHYVGGLSGFLKDDPPARLGRHAAGHRGDLPRGLPAPAEPAFPAASPPTSWPRSSSPPAWRGRTTRPTGSSP